MSGYVASILINSIVFVAVVVMLWPWMWGRGGKP